MEMSLTNKTHEELVKMLAEARHELSTLRFQASERQLKQVNRISAVRRSIAQIQTALSKTPRS